MKYYLLSYDYENDDDYIIITANEKAEKYNYDMLVAVKRVSRLYGMIEGYTPDGNAVMEDMISVGFVVDNLLLEKKEEGKNE